MQQYYKKIKGFTLIEILITIAIIGSAAGIVMTIINPVAQIQKSRDTRRKSDLRQMQAALELYRNVNGRYPPTASYPSTCGTTFALGTPPITYIDRMPCDPLDNDQYGYLSITPFNEYELVACLENQSDPDRFDPTNPIASSPKGQSCALSLRYIYVVDQSNFHR